MKLHAFKINEALNKAFLKLPLTRSQIEKFKANFRTLLQNYNPGEGEEHHKNVISEFLKKTYYSPDYYINTKGRYDLVIHNGKDNKSTVGVIIECKSPSNLADMPVIDNLKSKALYELILYYLRERITNQNLEIKHLIITNLFDWYIFDAHEFEKHFANNRSLVKQFQHFEEGRLSGKDTSFFYSSIAEPSVNGITEEFKFTYFNLQSFDSIINNELHSDDFKLIPPFKLLSPEHLLKLKFKNDSNSLDKDFYLELLHIIGLEEIKKGNKSLIGRAIPEKRNYGSLLECTITTIQSEDLLSQIDNLSNFGTTKDDQLFNISLELVITWINRILFLKLLEGQLIRYNKGDKSFIFLDHKNVPDFDALNKLFFYILAVPIQERDSRLEEKFKNVPYLNSSLFESTELERKTIRLSNLDDSNKIPISKSTVLKDHSGKRRSGEMNTLHYLLEFLDSYDFSSEGGKKIQEENKALINASVLGLIFEKINGYKDGSFFTPGYITHYMCHETITKSVIQKFNEIKGWDCQTITELHNKIEDIIEANSIINSLKICDPAVGSGHFLVSALNEIIALKSDLRLLMDRNGKVLREYKFEVVNDELIISDPDGEPFEYNPRNSESQRIQEAIFHEKQALIEGSLFGVDINPNSVKICRLRLWIELLKHAYYKQECLMPELETLPNIDINIKCGNSLISRYTLDANIKDALKSSKWTVDNYREAVMLYRNSDSKEQKKEMEKLISEIKNNFETEVSKKDKRFLRLNRVKGELLSLTTQQGLFKLEKNKKDIWNNRLKYLTDEQVRLEKQLEEIKSNRIYNDAFEWRFEFPEILNNDGDFLGFDIIIGNPPYIRSDELGDLKKLLKRDYIVFHPGADIYFSFYELSNRILKLNGVQCFINNSFEKTTAGNSLRDYLSSQFRIIKYLDLTTITVFDEATTYPLIILCQKTTPKDYSFDYRKILNAGNLLETIRTTSSFKPVESILLKNKYWGFSNLNTTRLFQKLSSLPTLRELYGKSYYGIKTGLNEAFIITKILSNPNIIHNVLEGKDMMKWTSPKTDKWIILFKEGITNFLLGSLPKTDAQNHMASQYPDIFAHLEIYKDKAEKRFDKGEYWWELRSCAYYDLFNSNKIIFPNLQKANKFSYDTTGTIINAPSVFLPTDDRHLLGILNSKLVWSFLSHTCVIRNGGFIEVKPQYFEQIPIPIISEKQKQKLESFVDEILFQLKVNPQTDISTIENQIDDLVFELYDIDKPEFQHLWISQSDDIYS